MNTHVRPILSPPDWRPHADAVRPRAWRADDLVRLEQAGIILESERIELIGGEIIAMAVKGARHELLRNELVLFWARRLPLTLKFAEESPLRLSEFDEPEPDIILFPASLRVTEVRGASVLLVVEVSDTSLGYDLAIKAPLYARFGVQEFWVIDAKSLATTVHRKPTPEGFGDVAVVAPHDPLMPLASTGLTVRIGDLGLEVM